jgi:glycosyltransferase involved in cell wall biosynthesis
MTRNDLVMDKKGNRFRVAHLVQDMKIGGQERVIQSILAAMNTEQYEPVLVCLSSGGAVAEELLGKGIESHILGLEQYNHPRSFVAVGRWLKDHKIDIVHTHAHPAGVLGRLGAALCRGIGVVHHVHTMPIDMNWRHHQKERALGFITDKVICVSGAIRDFILANEHLREEKTVVIHNGIRDPATGGFNRAALLDSLGIPHDAPVIGSVASLTENKGHACLLRAFYSVLKDFPDVRLLFLGDGPMRANLQGEVARMGIRDRVIFLGNQRNVFPFVALFDIFTLASLYREGLSVAIVEAMALGKAVVASRLQGITEVVQDGKNGILVTPGDEEGISRAMTTLLLNKDMRREMGEAGRTIYLEQFRIEHMMAQVEGIYETILRSRGRKV